MCIKRYANIMLCFRLSKSFSENFFFKCPNVEEERGNSPSGLSQMPYNGFHLRLQERMAMGLVAQGTEFFHQQGATLDPSFEGFHSTVRSDMRTVKRGQFGLGVRANIKHKNKFWGIISILKDTNFPPLCQRIDNDFHRKTDISGQ